MPLASWTWTVTLNAVPAVTVVGGWVEKPSLVAVPPVLVNEKLAVPAPAKPDTLAVTVYCPAMPLAVAVTLVRP